MPVSVNTWAAYLDMSIPPEVLTRLIARERAALAGRDPGPCPEEDKPFLAKHAVYACQAHDELVVQRGSEVWAHLSDNQPCPPATPPETT